MTFILHSSTGKPALLAAILITPAAALAFDDDFEINEINMVEENFLDIKAHRFRKSLEYQWYDNVTGWRMNGASLDGDFLFLQTELKLQHALSERVNVRLELEQEVFYDDKPVPYPTAEVEVYPFGNDLGFSLLGTPTYEKRNVDTGASIIWGRRPWNYVRMEYVQIDALYNDKNPVDDSYYASNPYTVSLEGGYNLNQYKIRFSYSKTDDLVFIEPDINGEFIYESDNYSLLLDYLPSKHEVIGITISGFNIDKNQNSSIDDRQQLTEYFSADAYWVTGMHQAYEIRLGLQYDYLSNQINDPSVPINNQNYVFDTVQVYSTVFHPFTEHMAWDLGLYLGDAKEDLDYVYDNANDHLNEGFQGKIRSAFIYRSSDGRNTLQFNLSADLDEIATDGGAISFQSVF